jgi:hypothetical protein
VNLRMWLGSLFSRTPAAGNDPWFERVLRCCEVRVVMPAVTGPSVFFHWTLFDILSGSCADNIYLNLNTELIAVEIMINGRLVFKVGIHHPAGYCPKDQKPRKPRKKK